MPGIEPEEFAQRLDRTRELMERENLDVLFVFSDEYRPGHAMYYTGFRTVNMIEESSEAVFITRGGSPVVFTGNLNTFAARRDSMIPDVRPITALATEARDIVAQQGMTARRVGLVGENLLPLATFRMLAEGLPGAEFVDAEHIVTHQRRIKSPAEIELLRQAARIGDMSLRASVRQARPGISEAELVAIGEHSTRIAGGEFFGAYIVVGGPNTDLPTWRSSDREVRRDELVMLDYAPVYQGYCGDVAITVAMEGASAEQRSVLDFATEACERMVGFMQPGRPATEVFEKTRDLVKAAGFEDHFLPYTTGMRAVGHGVGLDVVEPPDLGPNSDFDMAPGMVLAAKFDLHGFSWGGLRVERVVAVLEGGPESLNDSLPGVSASRPDEYRSIRVADDISLPW